ncbi:MAG: peptide chain release factor aRF-1 [Candidatus Bilamarchaeaceae archaeon]
MAEEKTKSEKLFELKRWLKMLSSFSGSGTELISVYIPAGSPVHEMGNRLRQEMSQASNIKSKTTRTNVLGALERIINHLKLFRETPPNGLAVFAGNISDNPAKVDIQLFSLEPPEPLKVGIYRCDSRFFLEPLERILETRDTYGVVVMDGREATLAIVRGTETKIVDRVHSMAHAKIRKGGQSARRFERLREESIEYYYKKVGEKIDEHFLERVKGIVIGGPGPVKDIFVRDRPFNYQIKVLGVVDTGYTDEYGVQEVIGKSEALLAQQELVKEKTLINNFIKDVVHEGLATYGEKEVREAITTKQAERVLLSEGLDYKIVWYKCAACGAETYRLTRTKPEEHIKCTCGGDAKIITVKDLIDDLEDLARANNIPVEIISTDTSEGAQFLHGFGGVGAFLRYKTAQQFR